MEEIDQRLRTTSDACIKAFETWRSAEKSASTREALQDAVHELRKVASRLEIEMAISERKEATSEPIAIPEHKSFRRAKNAQPIEEDNGPDMNDFQNRPKVQRRGRTRRNTGEGNGNSSD